VIPGRRGACRAIRLLPLLIFFLLPACRRKSPGRPQQALPPPPEASAGEPVRTWIHDVDLHLTETIQIRVERLEGRLLSLREGQPPVFDDKTSFTIAIESAEISIDQENLSHVMNDYTFAGKGSPLSEVTVRIHPGGIEQTARLRKAAGVPVFLQGPLQLQADGRIRLHPEKIRAGGVPVKGLLDLFGVKLAKLIKPDTTKGVSLEGDDVFLDPEKLLPPPAIRGKLAAMRMEEGRIVEFFGGEKEAASIRFPVPESDNFLYYRGGHLRFGKLTMHETDLEIVDQDPRDPFDLHLDRYNEQLVAGYSKNQPDYGLKVFMPDFAKLGTKEARPRPE
jgi:hypothetical protein